MVMNQATINFLKTNLIWIYPSISNINRTPLILVKTLKCVLKNRDDDGKYMFYETLIHDAQDKKAYSNEYIIQNKKNTYAYNLIRNDIPFYFEASGSKHNLLARWDYESFSTGIFKNLTNFQALTGRPINLTTAFNATMMFLIVIDIDMKFHGDGRIRTDGWEAMDRLIIEINKLGHNYTRDTFLNSFTVQSKGNGVQVLFYTPVHFLALEHHITLKDFDGIDILGGDHPCTLPYDVIKRKKRSDDDIPELEYDNKMKEFTLYGRCTDYICINDAPINILPQGLLQYLHSIGKMEEVAAVQCKKFNAANMFEIEYDEKVYVNNEIYNTMRDGLTNDAEVHKYKYLVELFNCVNAIDPTIANSRQYIKIVYCIISETDTKEDALNVSIYILSRLYKEFKENIGFHIREIELLINSYKKRDNGVTIGTFLQIISKPGGEIKRHMLASEYKKKYSKYFKDARDGKKRKSLKGLTTINKIDPDLLISENDCQQRFDESEDYYFSDLLDEMTNNGDGERVFKSFEDMIAQLIVKLQKCFVLICDDEFVMKRSRSETYYRNKISSLSDYVFKYLDDDNEKVLKINFKYLLVHHRGLFRKNKYLEISCEYKFGENMDRRNFYVSRTYPRKIVDDLDDDKLDFILNDYIMDVLCDNDKECYDYMMLWLATMCQKPHIKLGKAPVFYSKIGGSGKGTFFNLLAGLVGKHNWAHASGLSCLKTDGENGFMKNCKLLTCDDLSDLSKVGNNGHNVMERIKHYLTEGTIMIKELYLNRKAFSNSLIMAFATNRLLSLMIEGEDRRFFILQVNDKWVLLDADTAEVKQLKENYWTKINTFIASDLMMDMLYTYLMTYDIKKDIRITKPPTTKLKKMMTKMAESSDESFYKYFMDDIYNIIDSSFESDIKRDDNKKCWHISTTRIYQLYREFFTNNGYSKECKKDRVLGAFLSNKQIRAAEPRGMGERKRGTPTLSFYDDIYDYIKLKKDTEDNEDADSYSDYMDYIKLKCDLAYTDSYFNYIKKKYESDSNSDTEDVENEEDYISSLISGTS